MIADIHQDWLLKLIQRGTLQRFDPGYGRTLFSWLFSSMRYHFLGVCLASKKKKFHWENFEIPISQLVDENGEPLTLEALEQENLDS
jgi:hypothetical protein